MLGHIGENIKKRRTELNMTQVQLEEAAGLPIKSVYFYESGKRQVPPQYIKPIADALKMTIEELLGYEKEKSAAEELAEKASVELLKLMKDYHVERK